MVSQQKKYGKWDFKIWEQSSQRIDTSDCEMTTMTSALVEPQRKKVNPAGLFIGLGGVEHCSNALEKKTQVVLKVYNFFIKYIRYLQHL